MFTPTCVSAALLYGPIPTYQSRQSRGQTDTPHISTSDLSPPLFSKGTPRRHRETEIDTPHIFTWHLLLRSSLLRPPLSCVLYLCLYKFVFVFNLCLYLQCSLLPLRAQRNPPSCPLQCNAMQCNAIQRNPPSCPHQLLPFLRTALTAVHCYHWVGTVDMGGGGGGGGEGLLLVHHRWIVCGQRKEGRSPVSHVFHHTAGPNINTTQIEFFFIGHVHIHCPTSGFGRKWSKWLLQ